MKKVKIEPTIKRSLAASLIGCTAKTLRREELRGNLTPIKRNSRAVYYTVAEVEKLRLGEIATPSPVTLNTAAARAASGQFVRAE